MKYYTGLTQAVTAETGQITRNHDAASMQHLYLYFKTLFKEK
jgi:hypothetical protein